MVYIGRDSLIAAIEELVLENQIQRAADLLVSADANEQLFAVTTISPDVLNNLYLALSPENREEVFRHLSDEARIRLTQILEEPGDVDGRVEDSVIEPVAPSTDDDQVADSVDVRTGDVLSEAPVVNGRTCFRLVDGRLQESAPADAEITIYSDPSALDHRELLERLDFDEHTLASALDPDEISRLEYDEDRNRVFIVWKMPLRETDANPETMGLASMGMLLENGNLTIITSGQSVPVRAGDKAKTAHEALLRVIAASVNEFLVELKAVRRTSREIQSELTTSIENRQLLRMFNLSEGLVYHINAIDANGGVLRKLRSLAARLGFDNREIDVLEDVFIDNNQCSQQGQVFSTVLAGMLDARGNLVNNNMNVLLKNLTIINIIFLPLSVLTGIAGSSEFTMMADHYAIDWRIAYPMYVLSLVVLGSALWLVVRASINRTWSR